MIHDELALAVEHASQIQRPESAVLSWAGEGVVCVDFDHRRVGSELGEFVTLTRMLFLLLQEFEPRLKAFFGCYDLQLSLKGNTIQSFAEAALKARYIACLVSCSSSQCLFFRQSR